MRWSSFLLVNVVLLLLAEVSRAPACDAKVYAFGPVRLRASPGLVAHFILQNDARSDRHRRACA